jgi:hypothetical protein
MTQKRPHYMDGFAAFELGLSLSANPHPYGTRKFLQWNSGYKIARDEFIADDIADNLGVENECYLSLVFSSERFSE